MRNPRRNILLATVLTCLFTGVIASVEVYIAQLVWGGWKDFPDIDTAFVFVAQKAGGTFLFHLINISLLVSAIGGRNRFYVGGRSLTIWYGQGKCVAPENSFGVVDSKSFIPRNNVLFVGTVTLIGVFVLNFQLTAEMLNFGAFIAFMGVNLSVFFHFFVKEKNRKFINIVPPVIGFLFCFFIWINLSNQAKIAGTVWISAGMIFGLIKTKGFRKEIFSFDTTND